MVAVIPGNRRDPQRWHENKKGVPRGYSYQTGRVHKDWQDFDRTIKTMGEKRGEVITIETEDDYRKMGGKRFSFCCNEVRPKYSKCPECKKVVGC